MRLSIWAAAGLQLFGLACGQSDPPDPDTGSGSYYPLVDGARYRYLHSKGGWVETVTIAAVDGEPDTFEQTQSPNPGGESGTSVVVEQDGEVLRVSEEQFLNDALTFSVSYEPGFVRFAEAWAEEEPGYTEPRTYDRTETAAGAVPKAPQPRAHVFTVDGIGETVEVPAGTFRNCVVIRRERDLTNTTVVNVTTQDEQRKVFWFAPGVGKVREENLDTGGLEELVDYEIPEA